MSQEHSTKVIKIIIVAIIKFYDCLQINDLMVDKSVIHSLLVKNDNNTIRKTKKKKSITEDIRRKIVYGKEKLLSPSKNNKKTMQF